MDRRSKVTDRAIQEDSKVMDNAGTNPILVASVSHRDSKVLFVDRKSRSLKKVI